MNSVWVRGIAGAAVAAMMLMGCGEHELTVDNQDAIAAEEAEPLAITGVNADRRTLNDMVTQACSTISVKGLSQQLVDEIECISPGTLAPIPKKSNLVVQDVVFPFLQKGAAEQLGRALDSTSTRMVMTSALRTLPQQYLLYQWSLRGRCGIPIAARPGRSNHESGLAIDLSNYGSWRARLANFSYRWFGPSDPWHFDFTGPSTNIRSRSVLAFQRLWNRNNPGDRIAEDGAYGPNTEARLRRAPAVGFPTGATCNQSMTPPTDLDPIEVYWARQGDGSYNLRALAPSRIQKVEYVVDGFVIGEATRAGGANFPDTYTFSAERRERDFEVLGFDASGDLVGRGVGLIDVTPEYGVYIRQLGDGLYAIGLERAPGAVDHIEVRVDGYDIGDSVGSARPEVRYTFQQRGERDFEISTFNADGSLRGTLRRTFTID